MSYEEFVSMCKQAGVNPNLTCIGGIVVASLENQAWWHKKQGDRKMYEHFHNKATALRRLLVRYLEDHIEEERR